ncbi:MAG: hypothetical protein LBV04_09560 [Deferribacteraceae bacterium]|jgi:hypothetical protein|nr:hypothetical protein [Deferribacteraceae bacterium]
MKRFLVSLLVISLFVACSSGGSGGANGLKELDVTVSGTFGSGGKFTASSAAAPASMGYAMPTAITPFMLTGKLDDGAGKVYAIEGTYNSETESYLIQATSADFIYTLNGKIDPTTGNVNDIEMIKSEKQGSTWASVKVSVSKGNVTISANVTEQAAITLPAKWLGAWDQHWTDGGESGDESGYSVIALSPMGYIVMDETNNGWEWDAVGIIYSVSKVSDTEYTITFSDCHDMNGTWGCENTDTSSIKESSPDTLLFFGSETVNRM